MIFLGHLFFCPWLEGDPDSTSQAAAAAADQKKQSISFLPWTSPVLFPTLVSYHRLAKYSRPSSQESLILRWKGPQVFRTSKCWDHLESFKRNYGEKLDRISSVSTRLLCCHWPQINCQESGSEQMWPTLNWLHQHSLPLSQRKRREPSVFGSRPQHGCFTLQTHKLFRSDKMESALRPKRVV